MVAENARDESVVRVTELEQRLRTRDQQMQEDAERCSLRLQEVKAALPSYLLSNGFETDSESHIAEGVRCLVVTVRDKSAVSGFLQYYYYGLNVSCQKVLTRLKQTTLYVL